MTTDTLSAAAPARRPGWSGLEQVDGRKTPSVSEPDRTAATHSRGPKVRIDDELGPVRWCGRCAEWWPDDEDFWLFSAYQAGDVAKAGGRLYVRKTSGLAATCRSCHADLRVRGHIERKRRAGVVRHQCRRPPNTRPCPVLVPVGRSMCYGCSGETAGPMTSERLGILGRCFT